MRMPAQLARGTRRHQQALAGEYPTVVAERRPEGQSGIRERRATLACTHDLQEPRARVIAETNAQMLTIACAPKRNELVRQVAKARRRRHLDVTIELDFPRGTAVELGRRR